MGEEACMTSMAWVSPQERGRTHRLGASHRTDRAFNIPEARFLGLDLCAKKRNREGVLGLAPVHQKKAWWGGFLGLSPVHKEKAERDGRGSIQHHPLLTSQAPRLVHHRVFHQSHPGVLPPLPSLPPPIV